MSMANQQLALPKVYSFFSSWPPALRFFFSPTGSHRLEALRCVDIWRDSATIAATATATTTATATAATTTATTTTNTTTNTTITIPTNRRDPRTGVSVI
ncbi:hypothetical protein CFIMG_002642RA [Ceratocystis fimbriata CBS 114723]|uniref:Uncharacterized protein n=1 Tax=Ceratocystis fimbriata CBS 114723 TaxID=1035309 RepID=A0A2C5X975_9PEZI|nr:hypothetical protein CFIMG_002642RA [Ceratocystis fimbriata CBS 114723]